MTKRNIEITDDGTVKLIKAPLQIKQSLKKYSTTYEQRQADDNNNLVRNTIEDLRCLICQQFFSAKSLEHLKTCHHTFCPECIHNYILYKITVNEQIECPLSSCKEIIITMQTCYERIPERYKKRYQQFKVTRQNLSSSTKIHCQATNCQGTIDLANSSLNCSTCPFSMCNLCHLKKHEGNCNNAYAQNFVEWTICPDCEFFNQKIPKTGNKTSCKCGHKYCFVCRQNWSEAHKICSQQVDSSLDDDIFCRNQIIRSSRCWNFIKSIVLLSLLPFLLIFIALALTLTAIGSVLFAILFSPCLSFSEYDTCPKAFFCIPCVGLYKIGVFIRQNVGMLCSISCDFIGRLGLTIKNLCSYEKNGEKNGLQKASQSNQIQTSC